MSCQAAVNITLCKGNQFPLYKKEPRLRLELKPTACNTSWHDDEKDCSLYRGVIRVSCSHLQLLEHIYQHGCMLSQ